MQATCLFVQLLYVATTFCQRAYGPIPYAAPEIPYIGWVDDHHKSVQPRVDDGVLRVQGDARLYLVKDHREIFWEDHEYVRLDLSIAPLRYAHRSLNFVADFLF